MDTIPEGIAYIAKKMFERNLTDISGGNISAREGDIIHCTPRYAGSKHHWNLSPEDIVSGSVLEDSLMYNPSFSREGLAHLYVYRELQNVNAIIHAHPLHVLPFCSLKMEIEPVLESAKIYGTLPFIDDVPRYSQEQAQSIISNLRLKEPILTEHAAAVLMPNHGIFVAGADLWQALDALDRINTNAWCIIAQKMLSA